jgi:hypothetical protein
MLCNECGEQLDDDNKFCSNCSNPVKGSNPSRSSNPSKQSKQSKQSKPSKPRIVPPRNEQEYIDDDPDTYEDEIDEDEDFEEIEPEKKHEPLDEDSEDKNHFRRQERRPVSKYKCPRCGGDVQYVQNYNDYWCDLCRRYPFRSQTMVPTTTSSTVRAIYAIAFITSLVGGLLLLFTDFGGWHNYDYYNKIRTYGYIGPYASPFAFAAFFLVAFGLFYCSIISLKGIRMGEYLSKRLVLSGFIVALIVLIIIGIGAGALFALVDASDIWLESGFYGGAIGSLLTVIFFGLNLKNTVLMQGKNGQVNTHYNESHYEQ